MDTQNSRHRSVVKSTVAVDCTSAEIRKESTGPEKKQPVDDQGFCQKCRSSPCYSDRCTEMSVKMTRLSYLHCNPYRSDAEESELQGLLTEFPDTGWVVCRRATFTCVTCDDTGWIYVSKKQPPVRCLSCYKKRPGYVKDNFFPEDTE